MTTLQSNFALSGCLISDPAAAKRTGMHSNPRICAAVKQEREKREGREEEVMQMIKNSTGKGRSNWWSPLFQFSPASDPDWSQPQPAAASSVLDQKKEAPVSDFPPKHVKPFANFTREKARLLRQEMLQLETWHDTMYHSAIAARLAVEQKRVM